MTSMKMACLHAAGIVEEMKTDAFFWSNCSARALKQWRTIVHEAAG
jgi:hypothetical protein